MRLLSVNVRTPERVPAGHGDTILTSIFKQPVAGRVAIRGHNLDGDRQADLTVHGGPYKAIYAYPSEHYTWWRHQLPDMELPFGMFGENLTTEGLLEDEVSIGDRFRVGASILQITQPRMPCFKLNLRFDRPDMVKRFWQSERSGFYFSVVEEGELAAGDLIGKVAPGPEKVSVLDVVRLHRGEASSDHLYERVMRAPLYGGWKADIRERRS